MTSITLAAITGAHGIKGEVRLKLFAETPDSLLHHQAFDVGGRTLTLASIRPDKGGAVARFAEITDRTAAEALRGLTLAVARDALPPLAPGEYYHADLLGMAVVGSDGAAVGTVVAVENYGAGDILEIEKPGGKTFMVPFNPRAVPEVGQVTEAGAVIVVDIAYID